MLDKLDDKIKLYKFLDKDFELELRLKEALVQDYFAVIVDQILKKFNSVFETSLIIRREHDIVSSKTSTTLNKIKTHGNVEFVIQKSKQEVFKDKFEGIDIKERNVTFLNLIIAEIKKDELKLGFVQNLFQLRDAYESNGLKQPFIFGIASTCKNFKFTLVFLPSLRSGFF